MTREYGSASSKAPGRAPRTISRCFGNGGRLIEAADRNAAQFDAVVYPTVPFIAPTFEALHDDREYARINALALRNPSIVNFLDRCALSIPIHEPGEAPVGMNLMGGAMGDRDLLALAGGVESLLAGFG